jgi:DNA-binding LytR/AlgR family response regulator
MKITILEKQPNEEDEIIIKCDNIDPNIINLLSNIKSTNTKMTFYKENNINIIEQKDIFYFESVDDIVFAYTKDNVFETKSKLYLLEEELPKNIFFRANKAVILNVDKIKSLSPAFSGRFEAKLENGFRVIISRNYVPKLKELLGIK